MNSLRQGGRPVDVAETVAFFAEPGRRRASTATSCGCAGRACSGRDAARTLDRSRASCRCTRARGRDAVPAPALPFLPGGGDEIPTDLELELAGVAIDPAHLAAYARVCGFALARRAARDVPARVAFPLHLALMADGRFPFGAVGLVHVANRIATAAGAPRRAARDARAADRARAPSARPRRSRSSRRRRLDGDVVWREESTFLRREGGGAAGAPRDARRAAAGARPSGACPATSAAATPPSRATATRSTCTTSARSCSASRGRSPTGCGRRPAASPPSSRPARRLHGDRALPAAGAAAVARHVRPGRRGRRCDAVRRPRDAGRDAAPRGARDAGATAGRG